MPINNNSVIKIAQNCGFDLIGFAEAKDLNIETNRLTEWLNKGYHAGMGYMTRNLDKRKDVINILPAAKSVISLGMNYYSCGKHSGDSTKGKISRYAWGKDYHLIIWDILEKIINRLQEKEPSFEAISYVDTGPVMDKAWALRSGLGWQGKHTNIINKEIGSWFFIANLITNWEFEYSNPIEDFCGSCTACIDACPTNAIVEEYVVDSNRCISYLTIENKTDIPEEFHGKFENWLFGCDICQDVCPWNVKFSKNSFVNEFNPRDGNQEIELNEVLGFTQKDFDKKFTDTPIKRAKLKGLKRNAEFLLKNKLWNSG
jgi:epoxyqueuosine reductase